MDAKRVGLLALLVVVVIGIIGAILGFILGFHKADDPGIVCIKREMGDTLHEMNSDRQSNQSTSTSPSIVEGGG